MAVYGGNQAYGGLQQDQPLLSGGPGALAKLPNLEEQLREAAFALLRCQTLLDSLEGLGDKPVPQQADPYGVFQCAGLVAAATVALQGRLEALLARVGRL